MDWNFVTILLFAVAALCEGAALFMPRTVMTVVKPDPYGVLKDGRPTLKASEPAWAQRWNFFLPKVALLLTTAGGFASLWAPGFAE